MDGFLCIRIDRTNQVLPDLLCHERNDRSRKFTHGDKAGIQRLIGIDLVLLHPACPESGAASADVPVAQVIHEALQGLSGFRDAVGAHEAVHIPYRGIQSGQDPSVHDRKLVIIKLILCCIEFINVCIEHIERVSIPERAEELALSLHDGAAVETTRQPGCAAHGKVPANSVRPVGFKGFHRIDGISL